MFFAESLIGSPIDFLALPLWGYLEDTLRINLRVHLSERKPDYFEDTLVGKENRSASRRKARFHEDMWNAYFRTIEGFHRGFESMLQMSSPDIWKFVEAIQRQQSLQVFTLYQLQLKKKVHASKKKCLPKKLPLRFGEENNNNGFTLAFFQVPQSAFLISLLDFSQVCCVSDWPVISIGFDFSACRFLWFERRVVVNGSWRNGCLIKSKFF